MARTATPPSKFFCATPSGAGQARYPSCSRLLVRSPEPIRQPILIASSAHKLDTSCSNPADHAYMEHLKNLAYSLLGGPSAIQLYTTDGGSAGYLSAGTLPGEVYATGDFGPTLNPGSNFAAQNQFNPPGQRANTDSEYYPGWLTHWGESMANTSSLDTAAGLSVILSLGASYNLYMAHGGTNFGFWNGANGGGSSFQPTITSYDYDAPISEGKERTSAWSWRRCAPKHVCSFVFVCEDLSPVSFCLPSSAGGSGCRRRPRIWAGR